MNFTIDLKKLRALEDLFDDITYNVSKAVDVAATDATVSDEQMRALYRKSDNAFAVQDAIVNALRVAQELRKAERLVVDLRNELDTVTDELQEALTVYQKG